MFVFWKGTYTLLRESWRRCKISHEVWIFVGWLSQTDPSLNCCEFTGALLYYISRDNGYLTSPGKRAMLIILCNWVCVLKSHFTLQSKGQVVFKFPSSSLLPSWVTQLLTVVPASRKAYQLIARFGEINQPMHERHKLQSMPLGVSQVLPISLIRDHLVSADKCKHLSDAELCVLLFITWQRESVCECVCGGGCVPISKNRCIGILSQSSINHFRGGHIARWLGIQSFLAIY